MGKHVLLRGRAGWRDELEGVLLGSSDAANSITVNKPPASLWVMAVSSRIFGINPWSILVPQALEAASTRWLLAAATFVGFAFLAKSRQVFLVVPAFALVYLVAAPTELRRRAAQLIAAGVALVVTGCSSPQPC